MEDTVNITCQREGSFATVDLSGRWSISAGEVEIVELQTLVARLIASERVHVTFDLRELEALDARGLGEIAQTHKNLRSAGGELTLLAPNGFIRKMLAVTRLDSRDRRARRRALLQPSERFSRAPLATTILFALLKSRHRSSARYRKVGGRARRRTRYRALGGRDQRLP